MTRKRWNDYSTGQRRAIGALGACQLALAVAAWIDLARRPADRVAGPKPWWAAVIAVNFVGPIAYFRWGRKTHLGPQWTEMEPVAGAADDLSSVRSIVFDRPRTGRTPPRRSW